VVLLTSLIAVFMGWHGSVSPMDVELSSVGLTTRHRDRSPCTGLPLAECAVALCIGKVRGQPSWRAGCRKETHWAKSPKNA